MLKVGQRCGKRRQFGRCQDTVARLLPCFLDPSSRISVLLAPFPNLEQIEQSAYQGRGPVSLNRGAICHGPLDICTCHLRDSKATRDGKIESAACFR